MLVHSLCVLALSPLVVPSNSPRAPQALQFPLERELGASDARFTASARAVEALVGRDAVVFEGVPLPNGDLAQLELRRLPQPVLEVLVDQQSAPGLLESAALSLWAGTVTGDANSDVFLSFSNAGCHGWIASRGERWEVLAPRGSEHRSRESGARIVSARSLANSSAPPPSTCSVPPTSPGAPPPNSLTSSSVLLECRVAVETDWQLFQRFNDVEAEFVYVASLLAAVGQRYREQLQVRLTVPTLALYTTANDPWTAPDQATLSVDAMLQEFATSWTGSIPADAHVAHFLSGAPFGGGLAYVNSLCNPSLGFGISGIEANLPFPPQPGPLFWDFFVVAHELGHNFGAQHTHAYCPPIDQCAPSGDFGPCQTVQACSSQGTLMSYCHACSGGVANITGYFHPLSISVMRAAAEASCLPEVGPVDETFDTTANGSMPPGWAHKTSAWLFYQSFVSVESATSHSAPKSLLLNATPLAIQSLWCQASYPWQGADQTTFRGWHRTDATIMSPSGFNKGYVGLSSNSVGTGNVPLLSMRHSPTAGLQFVDAAGGVITSAAWDVWHSVSITLDRTSRQVRYEIGGTHALIHLAANSPLLGTSLSQIVLFQWVGGGWWDDVQFSAAAAATNYCTSGTSTNGCTPTVVTIGAPRASTGGGFHVVCTGLEGQRIAYFYYGAFGRTETPWGASTSTQCVAAPRQRMGNQLTGGAPGVCNGVLTRDWTAWIAGNPGALGAPLSPGAVFNLQTWYRDPPSPKTTNLSDAIEFTIVP